MFRVGCVVKALAGKEKGQFFVIVGLDDKCAYLSDGKRLRKNNPKKKSFKHIKLADSCALNESEILDKNDRVNALIRKFLSKIKE